MFNHIQSEYEPLYPGCEGYTKMKALVKFYNLKAKYEISDTCFSEMLLLVGSMLPQGNTFPSSFSEAKKSLCALGMEYEKIHVCLNDCLLYRGERDEDEMKCRIYQASRWKLNKKGDELEGIPAKVLWYFPLIPHLRNLFNSPQTSKDLTWHDRERLKDGNIIKGYNGCPICVDQTKATRLVNYRKCVVMRHRRWLPPHHPYRRKKQDFDNTVEKEIAPVPLTGEEVLERVQHLKGHVYGKTQRQSRLKKGDAPPLWKKVSIFFELEYWKFLPVRHVLDVMHIEKNICESLLGTMLNIPKKTKDKESVRIDMAEMGIRTELRPKTPGIKEKLPLASWNLTHSEKKVVCSSFLGMKLPDGFCSNIQNLVSMENLRLTGMKSHDCHTILHHLLPIVIRSSLQKQVRKTIIKFCLFFKAIYSKVIEVDKLEKMQSQLVETLCQLEKYFPPSLFDLMFYISVHLVREVELCGPIFLRWMYPFERYMKTFKGYIRNRARAEGCIAEAYIAEEAVECLVDNEKVTIGVPKKIASNLADEKEISAEIRWIADEHNKDVPTFSGYRMDGVTFSTKDRDDMRQVQCSGVCVEVDTMVVQDINKGIKVDDLGYTSVNLNRLGFLNDPFVLAKHVKQVCYIDDPSEKLWSVVLKLPEKKYHEDNDDADEESVEVELENDCFMPNFPEIDDSGDDMDSYMRDVDELIQLS
ncbi:uncharacterized protein LOC141702017 [Apium graveolens]|uniref:uncharacterized protein LOC141702017 n=1 Tax=Apium graveolens TaxID=4045 RepID=UPI003D7A6849